jgi:hypothetical protein
VDVPHTDAGRVQGVLRDWCAGNDAVVADVTYAAEARFTLLVPPTALDAMDAVLAEASAGRLVGVRGDVVVLAR